MHKEINHSNYNSQSSEMEHNITANPKIGIIGAGTVGTALYSFFGPDSILYDIRPGDCQDKDAVNACDIAFVCVPTPSMEDGKCDTSIVEEVVSWAEAPLIIIRSTVSPGTTDQLRRETGKCIIFQPEYLGETPRHPYANIAERDFVVLGGVPGDTLKAADFYKLYYDAMVRYYFCDALTAELAKYMENAFFATKVTFVNEFYDIASACGVNYNALREIWLADTRISRYHTDVYPSKRGFSGKCLPKDLEAIIASCKQWGYDPSLLTAVSRRNEVFQELSRERQKSYSAKGVNFAPRAQGT